MDFILDVLAGAGITALMILLRVLSDRELTKGGFDDHT